MKAYWYGWQCFWRAYAMARRKQHGAGKMPILNALKMGASCRYIVYGQKHNSGLWWFKYAMWKRSRQ